MVKICSKAHWLLQNYFDLGRLNLVAYSRSYKLTVFPHRSGQNSKCIGSQLLKLYMGLIRNNVGNLSFEKYTGWSTKININLIWCGLMKHCILQNIFKKWSSSILTSFILNFFSVLWNPWSISWSPCIGFANLSRHY